MKSNSVRQRTMPLVFACVLALTGISGSFSTASAAVNTLDTAYSVGGASGNGVTGYARQGGVGDLFNAGRGVAVQTDGKIVVAGTFDNGSGDTDAVVVRYNTDGTPDTAFNNGEGAFRFGHGSADKLNAVALDSLGNIIVVGTIANPNGTSGDDVWVMRLTSAGVLDGSFGPNGQGELVVEHAGNESGNAVAIDSNRNIVVVGAYDKGGANESVWIMRILAAGTGFDPAFNFGDSLVVKGDTAGIHSGNAVVLDASGNIIVNGTRSLGGGDSAMWVLKVTAAGALDSNFGNNGEVSLGTNGAHSGNAVALDSGKIVLVGTYDWSNSTLFAKKTDIWIQRLNSNGTIDPSFYVNGDTGGASFGDNGFDTGNAVAIQDGMIIVVGTYDSASANSSVWVQRLKDNGQPSTTFNNGDSVFKYTALGKFSGNAVALQADKKIVVAGTGYIDSGVTSTVMSLRLNGTANLLAVSTVGSGTVSVPLPSSLLFNSVLNAFVENYAPGDVVTITASPSTGWLFAGWSDPGCPGLTLSCTVTMNTAKNITATFEIPRLTVTTPGLGIGSVTSSPAGITCASGSATGCSSLFTANVPVTLSAVPAWYSTFSGWSGASCTSGSCIVPMDQLATTVIATFTANDNVRLNGSTLYSRLLDAYGAAAGSTATIDAQVFSFLENLQLNKALTVSLNGGLGSGFAANPGNNYTTVKGFLKINAGRLNAKNIKVQ